MFLSKDPKQDATTLTDEEFNSQLAKLAEKWRSNRSADLRLRHRTGLLLNKRLGSPEKRQSRGEGVLEDASQQLGFSVSELSRMRGFAFHFSSVTVLNEEHPNVSTWSDVKALLPTLNPKRESKKESKTDDSTSAKADSVKAPSWCKSVVESLGDVTQQLQGEHSDLPKKQRKKLLKKLQELAEAVKNCLHIRVTIEDDGEQDVPRAAA